MMHCRAPEHVAPGNSLYAANGSLTLPLAAMIPQGLGRPKSRGSPPSNAKIDGCFAPRCARTWSTHVRIFLNWKTHGRALSVRAAGVLRVS